MLAGVPETDDGWDLPFAGEGVAEVAIDYRVSLRLGGGEDVVLGSPFMLTSPDGSSRTIDPSETADATHAVALVHQIISSAVVGRDGRLFVRFHSGHSLEAAPSDAFEAWEIVFEDGRLIVALPGGEVTSSEPNT